MLPGHVIEEDHKLERANTSLAELRWHWTLDESNPDRVTTKEYAEQVGRTDGLISLYARAYVRYVEEKATQHTISFSHCLALSMYKPEKQAALLALSEASGQAPQTIRQNHTSEVAAAYDMAKEAAEANGTTYEQELPAVAKQVVESRKSPAPRKPKASDALSIIQGLIAGAERKLKEARTEAKAVKFPEEHQEFMVHDLDRLRDALAELEETITGTRPATTDWDITEITEQV